MGMLFWLFMCMVMRFIWCVLRIVFWWFIIVWFFIFVWNCWKSRRVYWCRVLRYCLFILRFWCWIGRFLLSWVLILFIIWMCFISKLSLIIWCWLVVIVMWVCLMIWWFCICVMCIICLIFMGWSSGRRCGGICCWCCLLFLNVMCVISLIKFLVVLVLMLSVIFMWLLWIVGCMVMFIIWIFFGSLSMLVKKISFGWRVVSFLVVLLLLIWMWVLCWILRVWLIRCGV